MPKSKEQCLEIREKMRTTILHKAMIYFVKNGFSGTKISDLSKDIGIAAGTIYIYFESKEELFHEILSIANYGEDLKKIKMLAALPLPAEEKIKKISGFVLNKISDDKMYAAKIALNSQIMLEQGNTYNSTKLYEYTAAIIRQGQKEGTMAEGSSVKLADYYWSVIYVYALKRLFAAGEDLISPEDLSRTVLDVGRKL